MSAAAAKCYKCGAKGHIGADCTTSAAQPPSMEDAKVEQLPGGSVLREVYGDLLSSPDSICHCVSECLAMGAGIAVLFKQSFGRVEELKGQQVKVGGVATLDITSPATATASASAPAVPKQPEATPSAPQDRVTDELLADANVNTSASASAAAVAGAVAAVAASPVAARRYAYYLVTKPRYFHKPSYGTLGQSLAAMFDHMAANGIKRVAMPELGCGLDGLEWSRVRDLVANQISGKGIEVTVYHYKPAVRLYGRGGTFAGKKK